MGQHVMARFVMCHSLAWNVMVADYLNTIAQNVAHAPQEMGCMSTGCQPTWNIKEVWVIIPVLQKVISIIFYNGME